VCEIVRHLHVLWRLETTIAQARLRILTRRTVLLTLAGLIALFGLFMANAAAFLGLEPLWGPVRAALTAASADFTLAIVMGTIALGITKSSDLNVALELRRTAIDSIEAELLGQLPWMFGSRSEMGDTALLALFVPLITAMVRGLRKSKSGQQ
jgi:hypothetical protein